MKFTVVLHTDDGVRYGICVPDLPGCFSAGNDIELHWPAARAAMAS